MLHNSGDTVVAILCSIADESWMGGANYYKNIIEALSSITQARIRPIVFCENESLTRRVLALKPAVSVAESTYFCPNLSLRIIRKVSSLLGINVDKTARFIRVRRSRKLDIDLKKHQVDIVFTLTDSEYIGSVPSIGWIPDFMHVRLASFFTAEERASRDQQFSRLASVSKVVLLSSRVVEQDYGKMFPMAPAKTQVVHFTDLLTARNAVTTLENLKATFGISGPYVVVCNTFWSHKNHVVVAEALNLLAETLPNLTVMATGSIPEPIKSSEQFRALQSIVTNERVKGRFRILGSLPRPEQMGLIKNAKALINPSLSEGWNTAVEEAKNFGRPLILSDIPVHREQAPDAMFFQPQSAKDLASKLKLLLQKENVEASVEEIQAGNELRRKMFIEQVYGALQTASGEKGDL